MGGNKRHDSTKIQGIRIDITMKNPPQANLQNDIQRLLATYGFLLAITSPTEQRYDKYTGKYIYIEYTDKKKPKKSAI